MKIEDYDNVAKKIHPFQKYRIFCISAWDKQLITGYPVVLQYNMNTTTVSTSRIVSVCQHSI